MKGLMHSVLRSRARRLIRRISSGLPEAGKVLDIGSGTGHNGSEIVRSTDLELTEVDIVDMNLCNRPPVLYDGNTLPFAADSFSAALLIYILQYPAEPAQVLAEARRVATDKVVILQTVSKGGVARILLNLYEWAAGRGAFYICRLLRLVQPVTCPLGVHGQFSGQDVLALIDQTGGGLLSHQSFGLFPRHELFIIDAKEPR